MNLINPSLKIGFSGHYNRIDQLSVKVLYESAPGCALADGCQPSVGSACRAVHGCFNKPATYRADHPIESARQQVQIIGSYRANPKN